jgi:hypothetical protein
MVRPTRPRRRIAAMVVTLCIAATLPATAAGAMPSVASAWALKGAFAPVPGRVYNAACPTSTLCLAVGEMSSAGFGLMLRSADGGERWANEPLPAGTGPLWAVSCPTPTVCWAGAAGASEYPVTTPISLIHSANGGRTWTADAIPVSARGAEITTISCPDARHCLAAGKTAGNEYVLLSTADGGTRWTSETPFGPAASGGVFDVDCTSASRCIVVGDEQRGPGGIVAKTVLTRDGGEIWKPAALPTGLQDVNDVSCATPSRCLALADQTSGGSGFLRSMDGGASWSKANFGMKASAFNLDCLSRTICYGVGVSVNDVMSLFTSLDGGRTWKSRAMRSLPTTGTTLACVTGNHCVIVNGTSIVHRLQGGKALADPSLPNLLGVSGIGGIDCGSPTFCTATAGQGSLLVTQTGGSPWTRQRGAFQGGEVICLSATGCLTFAPADSYDNEFISYLEATTSSGSSWHAVSFPASNRDVAALSCGSTTSCVGLDSSSTDLYGNGMTGTWSTGSLAGAQDLLQPQGLSCISGSSCVAVGSTADGASTVEATQDGGETWSIESTLNLYLPRLQCDAGGTCVVSGVPTSETGETGAATTVLVSTDLGHDWTTATLPSPAPADFGAACLNETTCFGIGYQTAKSPLVSLLFTSTDGARTWVHSPDLPGDPNLDGVSCHLISCWIEATTSHGTLQLWEHS